MFFSSFIGMNRLISKGMSNLYYWERLTFSKLLFCKFQNLSPGQFLESSNSCRYNYILKLLVATYKSEVWEQNNVCLFHYFNFEMNYDVLKSKSPRILLNKNMNFNKNETETKMENPIHSFFYYQGFLQRHWRFTGQRGRRGDHLLFHSTTSTRSQTFRHLFATLHVRWLHVFLIATLMYFR